MEKNEELVPEWVKILKEAQLGHRQQHKDQNTGQVLVNFIYKKQLNIMG